ncbi:glycosyltransferase family 2 protein [Caldovatus aquaticus]|uniref:Glycosyltransferase n=1 Tax=Caldovatus aquaticus TaxID=2865671 RepID=A0ABS7F755_9PROT|nr:glycosyltransferase [Caldovatus aquaticus]
MKVSFLIKALNEEAHIARTIESCLAALERVDGEVILADCLSCDRTVAIASRYPIRIVQLENPADRGCGAAPQLGYQYARGEFVYLIDGDMAFHADFLPAALQAAAADERLAGVGGIVRERRVENLEFASRLARARADLRPGIVDRLDGGGLYRRAAIESVGYLSDRNLHAFEEFELATRLRARGWRLARLDRIAVDHYGYTTNAYRLLWARAKSGYALGAGELARAALGRPSLPEVVRKIRTLWISVLVVAWLAAIPSAFALAGGTARAAALSGALLAAPPAAMAVRRRSLKLGVYAVAVWIVYAIGTVRGFLRRRVDPAAWIPSRVLHDGTALPRRTVPARAPDARAETA